MGIFKKGPFLPTSYFGERTTRRENYFDYLRLGFAVLVIYAHSFPLLLSESGYRYELFTRLTHGQINSGQIAVCGFFVISGFLVTSSWQHSRGAGDYLRKRVLRIYPGFTAAWLFSALIVAPLGAASIATYFHELRPLKVVLSILRLQTVSPPLIPRVFVTQPYPLTVNGSLWTILYEFFCYLMVMGLGLLGAYRRKVLPLLLFALAYGAQGWIKWMNPPALYKRELIYLHFYLGRADIWPEFLTYFIAGMLFYLYRDYIPYAHRWMLLSVVLLVITGALGGMVWVMPLCGSYLLLYTAFSRPSASLAAPKIHCSHADLSYGVYLYAFPVQMLLVYWSGHALNPYTLFLATLPIVLLLAVGSWFGVEAPFLRLKKPAVRPRTAGYRNDGP